MKMLFKLDWAIFIIREFHYTDFSVGHMKDCRGPLDLAMTLSAPINHCRRSQGLGFFASL